MFFNFYRNKRVLVTGHTGFKGSWLSLWLHQLGAKVYGLALEPSSLKDHFVSANVNGLIEKSFIQDIRSYHEVASIVQEVKPEIIFHLAAQPLVRESYLDPRYNFETNVLGTVNLLEAAKEKADFSLQAIINVTTDKCYENLESLEGYVESSPLGGHDPYSASKACSEIITSSYRKSFFNQRSVMLASARAGNVIGGGDWSKDRIMSDCFKNLFEGKTVEVRNPHSIRPWQHVLEPLSGYLALAARKRVSNWETFADAWNFGPENGQERTVKEIVEKTIHFYGDGDWKDMSSKQELHESKRLLLNISKAKTVLEWSPALNFEESIEMTTLWYLQFKRSANMREVSINQLKQYCDKATALKRKWVGLE